MILAITGELYESRRFIEKRKICSVFLIFLHVPVQDALIRIPAVEDATSFYPRIIGVTSHRIQWPEAHIDTKSNKCDDQYNNAQCQKEPMLLRPCFYSVNHVSSTVENMLCKQTKIG